MKFEYVSPEIEHQIKYIIFTRLKNVIGFHRSQQFKDWFHQRYPDKDIHHVFGSIGKLKTSDYCSAPLGRIQHSTIPNEADWAIDNLELMIDCMIQYIRHLEELCNKE